MTFMGAAPESGKTELWFEFLINTSCKSGWQHIVFSPETGDFADVYAELCHKFIGKPWIKGEKTMDEAERVQAEMFIDEHFLVVDPIDEDLTLEEYYQMADEIENQFGWKFRTTTVDPWNDLTESYKTEDLGREDKYLSRILKYVRKNARRTGRHNCIITHVRDQKSIREKGIKYFPMATPRDFSGGQVWYRRALSLLIPWRPPLGLKDDDSQPYKWNELHLKVGKSKPKGVSKKGVYKMFLDTDRYQYYMIAKGSGKRIYADRGEYSTEYVEPVEEETLFEKAEKAEEDDKLPF